VLLPTLATAALICGASLVVGEAVARLLGLDRWRPGSPATGLALLIVVALAAIKLPGHGAAAAVVLAALVAGCAVIVLRGGAIPRPGWSVAALTGATLLGAYAPYISNGRIGIPAVGYTNDPSAHFVWIDNLRDMPASEGVVPGYPIGPHSLMAAIVDGTGMSVESIFSGLLIALPVLLGWAALSLLDGLGPARRALAATLVALAYTVSAFYAQAGFKELLLTLFLVTGLGVARAELTAGGARVLRVAVQVGLLCGATVAAFSYGGLAWPVLTALAWIGLAGAVALVNRRREGPAALARAGLSWLRVAIPAAAIAVATAALALVADLPRLLDSVTVFGASPAGAGTIVTENVGHLAGEVSKREVFGFWAREDFRFGSEATALNELLFLLAAAVAVYALIWWLWRRDLAVPAAVAAAMLISIRLSDVESAYTASKALAPAGALVMLMSARAILADPPPLRLPAARWIATAVALVFAASALWSSFLVLRGAHVGPRDHARELEQLQALTGGEPILFLGNDDYAEWELRPSQAFVLPSTREEKEWTFQQPLDFDSVEPATLDAAPYTITTRTDFRSEPPPNLRLVRSTASYELWQRTGPTPDREVLAGEGSQPGAVLDCSTAAGRKLTRTRGWARVWKRRPLVAMIPGWSRSIQAGDAGAAVAFIPPGRWEISMPYSSPQRLHVKVGREGGGSAAPNLDRPGPVWRIGEVDQARPGRRTVRLEVDEDVLGSKNHPALLSTIALSPAGAPRETIPLREACGRYVDWYTLGARRPPVPKPSG
jgi:hypothetical protein